jgi:hypothetical protein
MIITITNDFHNSEARCRPTDSGWLTHRQVRRIRRTLCGIDGCTCGGTLSERGRQEYEVCDVDTRPHAPYEVRVQRVCDE